MIYLALPEEAACQKHRLPFYLAMEEYAARMLEGDYFFMWQVSPTVIYGRNQVPEAEFDIDYCREHGIEFYRRKSGGGCVYADRNNVMFSHVADCQRVSATFGEFTGAVASMLRQLGITKAAATGRNDIAIGDRKVSGYAFYHVKTGASSRAIVHGTMLYDADPTVMEAVLTPSAVKLASKGVESVRSRITTIREHSDIGLDAFKRFARERICGEERVLTIAEVAQIRVIEQEYYRREWLFGRYNDTCRTNATTHIPGVGEIAVNLSTHGDCIANISLSGDFFSDESAVEQMLRSLHGIEVERLKLCNALAAAGIDEAIPGLGAGELADLIISENRQ